MLRSILIPLDGSTFAERAIPVAAELATPSKASIALVGVHDPSGHATAVHAGLHPRDPSFPQVEHTALAQYLERIRARVAERFELPVTATVLDGKVAESINRYARDRELDLVVLTTHGHGGLNKLWFGSVADELLRLAGPPLLLLRPDSETQELRTRPFERVLVPVDGSRFSERALELPVSLLGLREAEFVLLEVLGPDAINVRPTVESLSEEQDQALRAAHEPSYLTRVADELRGRGLRVGTRVKVDRSIAQGILHAAQELRVDLIAMSTRGASGVRRLILGSTADKVIRGTVLPVLLLRPEAEVEAEPHPAHRTELLFT